MFFKKLKSLNIRLQKIVIEQKQEIEYLQNENDMLDKELHDIKFKLSRLVKKDPSHLIKFIKTLDHTKHNE